ncbi:MAG: phosphatase PAP2 family protein [Nocardioidaceae bacterium]
MTPDHGSTSNRRTAAQLAGTWLLLCAVVVGVGRLLTGPLASSVGRTDDDLARWFADRRTPTLDTVAEVGTFLGDTLAGIIALLLLGVVFSRWRRTWLPLVFVTVAYVGLLGVYLVATHLDPRDRPPVEILDKGLVPDHSFPSGHTMTSTAVVWTVVLLMTAYTRAPRAVLGLGLVPVFTLTARMYQGAHHLTDVLAALAFAVVWLTVVTAVLFRPRVVEEPSH